MRPIPVVAATLSLALLTGLPGPAAAWETPGPGTPLRATLMDAVRPHAEWILGAPLVFRVNDLRVDGNVAFASLHPMRPDGTEVDPTTIPVRGIAWEDPFAWDGVTMQVLYQRSGDTWVAVMKQMGATDVWWAHPDFCPIWGSVVEEFC